MKKKIGISVMCVLHIKNKTNLVVIFIYSGLHDNAKTVKKVSGLF